MLSDEELLTFIKQKCTELGITGYEIANDPNVKITEMTAYRILDGTTIKPRRKNLLEILQFLEDRTVGSKTSEDRKQIPVSSYKYDEHLSTVQEEVESMYKKVSISDIFSDIGTELLISYKKQITVFELNTELFKKNSHLMEEKIQLLESSRN